MSFDIQDGILKSYIPDAGENAVIIPDGVTEISYGAFKLCKNLTHITIPEGVESIRDSAFFKCIKLKTVSLPASLREIGTEAFRDCYRLKTVTIAEGLVNIGHSAFGGCKRLEYIDMPNSVVKIGKNAFYNCIALSSIEFPDSLCEIGASAFCRCGIKELKIPPLITYIPEYTFEMCTSLRSVTLHSNIKRIGANAFAGCTELCEINYTPDNTEIRIEDDAFQSTPWLDNYPDDFVMLNGNLCKYKGTAKDIIVPESVKYICEKAFSDLSATSVTIPSSVESIQTQAFMICTNLRKITIGAHTICESAFIVMSAEEIILEDTVKDIDSGAFVFPRLLHSIKYLHSTENMPPNILSPEIPTLKKCIIYAPNVDISFFKERDKHLRAYHCNSAAAGYADMVESGHNISPEIATGYHKYLTEKCNDLLEYAAENEKILYYFCRYNMLDLKSTNYLLEQYSQNTIVTALLLQYKHDNFGDEQDYYQI